MVDNNQEIFEAFKQLHNNYALNPDNLQEKFNCEGEKILKIIREWEQKLCLQSEKGGYSHFTTGLSEKFWAEIREQLPKIDSVGIIRKTSFSIKKIQF